MTIFNFKTKTTNFLATTAALALIAGFSPALTPSAFAVDCLLDTNNDGDADSNVDTDLGADSAGADTRLACGLNASATGDESTALGRNASAGGATSAAVGFLASAAGTRSTALGFNASAAGEESTALGSIASAGGANSTALGYNAGAAGASSTALGRDASALGADSTALGVSSSAGEDSTALGRGANAAGLGSTALGRNSSAAGDRSTASGQFANAAGEESTALGRNASADGNFSTALGALAIAFEVNTIAIGAKDAGGGGFSLGAQARGANSIVIGAGAGDGSLADTVIIGTGATATEADQVILKSADTFTILGNGEMGLGTATPSGTLDVDAGMNNSTLVLSQSGGTPVQWEIKNNQVTGRMTFGPLGGNVPLKFGSTAVNNLIRIGTVVDDRVNIGGDMVVVGTVTTGGPTCGGGCDAVFDADYDLPSIEEHAAQMFANKHLPAVGPTKPLEPINLSERYGNLLNELEKAHIYIAQQEAKIAAQDARLERVEALLAQ